MPEQIERALRGCAEAGVPETVDLWPEIRESVSAAPQHSNRRFRLSPRTRIGWAFAVVAIFLIATTAAFAAAGALGVLDDLFGSYVPGVQAEELSAPINQTQTREGITVTIDRVYADSEYVVVGYTVESVDEREGFGPLSYMASLSLSDSDDERAILNTEGTIRGGGINEVEQDSPVLPEGSQALVDIFETTKPLEAGEDHRFRASVLVEGPENPLTEEDSSDFKQLSKPFVFNFTVPVKDAPTIEVNQTVEAGGSNAAIGGDVPITLTEIVLSPARTSAYLCYEPPDEMFDVPWVTAPKTQTFPGPEPVTAPVYHDDAFYGNTRKGCATYIFQQPLYDQPGKHSLTVTELHSNEVNTFIEGPWKFTFEVPEQ